MCSNPQRLLLALALLAACATRPETEPPPSAWWRAAGPPPAAPAQPVTLEVHGHRRIDPYEWMKNHEDPRLLAYLEAENAYAERVTGLLEPLRSTLVEELLARRVASQPIPPWTEGGWLYAAKTTAGSAHPVYYRRSPSGVEETLLDVGSIARQHTYCRVEMHGVSPGGRTLAWAADTVGDRRYFLRFKDLQTGLEHPEAVPGPVGNALFGNELFPSMVWANDGATVFYGRQDPRTSRLAAIYRHRVGTDPDDDVLVHAEDDPAYWLVAQKTTSGRWITLCSVATTATECRLVDAERPAQPPRLVLPRREGREYWLDHAAGDTFILRTNEGRPDFRVVEVALRDGGVEQLRVLREPPEGVLIEAMDAFPGHVVLQEREGGVPVLRRVELATGAVATFSFEERAFYVFLDRHQDPSTGVVRVVYSSPVTPQRLLACDLDHGHCTLEQTLDEVAGHDPTAYRTELLMAPARDGVSIPVTVVSCIGADGGPRPTVLHGYGSYGVTLDPRFDADRLGLLDRGFVWAVAHVRGGQALGRRWTEAGRRDGKAHTYQDFVDVARWLVTSERTSPALLFALGESAGGFTVGAAINEAPALFRGAVAKVPAVDLLSSMLDPNLPLVSSEYEEWGDPRTEQGYRSLLALSPYDNVRRQLYPHLLVTAGLHDRQVGVHEPAKWVAKLRGEAAGEPLILLTTTLIGGHSGASDPRAQAEATALIQAFLLRLAGLG